MFFCCGLKGQIESQELDRKRTLEGMQNRDENKIYFVKKYPIVNELYEKIVFEFMKWKQYSRAKVIEIQNVIGDLMNKVQDVQYEIKLYAWFKRLQGIRIGVQRNIILCSKWISVISSGWSRRTAEPRQKYAA